jgi:VanZ like family
VWRRWGALGAYVALLYAILPYGPRLGLALTRTAAGAWLLGPGLGVLVGGSALGLVVMLGRRGAPSWTYVALLSAALCYLVALSLFRAQRLERTHLPEYGIAAWLAWRAVAPLAPNRLAGYLAAAALGTAIGYGDELVQAVLPGRVYDLRDVAMNAVGAVLGVVVLAAVNAGAKDASGECSARR